MRRTKIVCTIGPASDDEKTIARLLKAGMNVARVNLSHGLPEEQKNRIRTIKSVSKKIGIPCAIMVDLKGPEVRISLNNQPEPELKKNQKIKIGFSAAMPPNIFYLTEEEFARIIKPGDTVILGDGDISLKILEKKNAFATAVVLDGGLLKNNQRIMIPGKSPNLPSLTDNDYSDISWAAKEGVDFFAQSFVRNHQDVIKLERELDKQGSNAAVIAKVEQATALDDIDAIIERSYGIMVARGDLGLELPPEDIPLIQKDLIRKANEKGVPVITATQMLESMTENVRPTRAEASDVANAILDGTDAIMLSEETAAGKYPVEATTIMDRIARKTEKALDYFGFIKDRQSSIKADATKAISLAGCELAYNLNAKAVVTSTQSGATARQVARHRPGVPVIAITPSKETYSRLLLSWGVTPTLVKPGKNVDEMFELATEAAIKSKLAEKGDTIIITAGVLVNIPGTTNLIKVQHI